MGKVFSHFFSLSLAAWRWKITARHCTTDTVGGRVIYNTEEYLSTKGPPSKAPYTGILKVTWRPLTITLTASEGCPIPVTIIHGNLLKNWFSRRRLNT